MVRHVVFGIVAALSAPALGQGAFNMGQLTGTVSQDAVTQAEAERAGASRKSTKASKASYRARLKPLCAQRAQYLATEGDSADYREVDRACRAEGF